MISQHRFVVVCGIISLGLSVPATQAQPRVSPWRLVDDPRLARREFVRAFADHKREPRDLEHATSAVRTQLYRAAAAWLEGVLGAKLDSLEEPELLLLYGECLAYAGDDYLDRAALVLTRALSLTTEPSAVASARNTLGRVQAARGELEAAYHSFERALESEWDNSTRNGVLIEQGLAVMEGGQFERAIERLTSARDQSSEPASWALAQWALGVATDRALLGPEGAELAWRASQARFGANGELDVLALPGVAPEPRHEVTYYRALALMGKAQALEANQRTATLLEAKFLWLAYLRDIGPLGPFISRARYHMAHIDELTTTDDDDGELDRKARAAMDLRPTDAGAAAADMIWPEEETQGPAFWGGDAGAP